VSAHILFSEHGNVKSQGKLVSGFSFYPWLKMIEFHADQLWLDVLKEG
jgi:hypothetical protein